MDGTHDEIRSEDMYGNRIWPLGETGFGVSVSWYGPGSGGGPLTAWFTFFHHSDGFRQSLFSVDAKGRPANVFYDRIAEVAKAEAMSDVPEEA